MNIEEKIKEIKEELSKLNSQMESITIRAKLLVKSLKQYEKLLEKAKEIPS